MNTGFGAVTSAGLSVTNGLPLYTVPDDGLGMGASLGNSAVWVTTLGTGAVQHVFDVGSGENLLNAVTIRHAARGNQLLGGDARSEPGGSSYVGLVPSRLGTIEIHPAWQRHRVTAVSLEIAETTFVPLAGGTLSDGDPAVVYQVLDIRNQGPVPIELRIFGYAHLRGSLPADVEARFEPNLHALVAHNTSRPEAVRVFGVSEVPSGFATSFDYARVYDLEHVRPLENTTASRGDVLGCLQVDLSVAAGEARTLAFITAVSSQGEDRALDAYRAGQDVEQALASTLQHLEDVLATGEVLTPDPVINHGALWSKVNMLRVMASYPQGPAVTNDPGSSSNVVGRDSAWFVYGCDHFVPRFSRALLDTLARLQYPSGKIPEYYNALDGRVEDDGLNINDDTPLFILAINHHFRATGDLDWLGRIYPAVVEAARYIVSQEDDRGLVFCSARDPRGNVWAIAGWRNVIPDYQINGAVTELNAECAAALRAAGHLTENLGRPVQDAEEFFDASRRLRLAVDRHLLNPQNGLYYLNIDVDGDAHTDVTGDQIFPVLFRVCSEEVGFRIISRLNLPDFWTPAGLRTASRLDQLYDPFRFSGLMGGVWPGLTWWYAFAAQRYHPDIMVKALRASFAHYSSDPKANNTVPGQFSEWFDGESLVNRGMRLSPWEPPRFFWAAIEGVCGFSLRPDRPVINPLVPADWKWVAVRQLPYHGRPLTYFAARQGERFHIYATADVHTSGKTTRYDEDVSNRVHAASDAAVVALRRPGELLVLVGNVGTSTAVVPLNCQDVLDPDAVYQVRIYNSDRGSWDQWRRETGRSAGSLAVTIEANGFRAVELRQSIQEGNNNGPAHDRPVGASAPARRDVHDTHESTQVSQESRNRSAGRSET